MNKYSLLEKDKLNKAIESALKMVDIYIDTFYLAYPGGSPEKFKYLPTNYPSWGIGFYPGMLWLAYELTGEEKYKKLGLSHVLAFKKRIEADYGLGHHDIGFMYSPSCVSAYKLTGNEDAKQAALMGAEYLSRRFMKNGGYIKAWGPMFDPVPNAYFHIIDCLINIPLLWWASKETGNLKYKEIADTHLFTAMDTVIRPDGSSYHNYVFDPETGARRFGDTKQGRSKDSCWSRGQAWGILGMAHAYSQNKDPKVLEKFKSLMNFVEERLPSDGVPYWDYDFPDGSDEPKDSSASAIMACGIMEMSKYVPDDDPDMIRYRELGKKMMTSLVDNYSSDGSDGKHGLIRRVTGSVPHGSSENIALYADYYYLEALLRCYLDDWDNYWC